MATRKHPPAPFRTPEESMELMEHRHQNEIAQLNRAISSLESRIETQASLPINLSELRNRLKKEVEMKAMKAFSEFDPDKALQQIEERLIGEALDVSDKLMGIDRRWKDIEIKEGRIKSMIQNAVDEMITDKLQPFVLAEVARLSETQSFKKALKQAAKERIFSALRELAYKNSKMTTLIDKLIQDELDAVTLEFTSPSFD